MFGNKKPTDDSLPVSVHVVRSAAAFAAGIKLWNENSRGVYLDHASNKELLHFAIAQPKTTMWLQRDAGRQDALELIISWQENRTAIADVFAILPGPEKAGDDSYVLRVLEGLLTAPSTVPVNQPGGAA